MYPAFVSSHALLIHLQLQEAVLSALASLSKENPSVSAVLARASPDYDVPPPLATIMSLCKTRSTDVQLASSLWYISLSLPTLFPCTDDMNR